MYRSISLACMCVHHKSAWCPQRSEKGIRFSRHTGSWELNLGPLQEQHVLLTAEPSLQSLFVFETAQAGLIITTESRMTLIWSSYLCLLNAGITLGAGNRAHFAR
jgi:hypothetical protein